MESVGPGCGEKMAAFWVSCLCFYQPGLACIVIGTFFFISAAKTLSLMQIPCGGPLADRTVLVVDGPGWQSVPFIKNRHQTNTETKTKKKCPQIPQPSETITLSTRVFTRVFSNV